MPSKLVNLSGGSNAVSGYGQQDKLVVGGTWLQGDTFEIILTSTTSFTIGNGRIAQALRASPPVFCFTFDDCVYVAIGRTFYRSAVGDPTGWEIQDTGSTFEDASTRVAIPEPLQAFASYQGRLAVFSRHSIQIWVVDADPNKFALSQVLNNIGTVAPLSVASVGDMDVLFLSDTGVRSLRVRDSSLNAYVSDLGSPIDEIIQAKLATLTSQQIAAACAVVEPTSNRYWLFLGDTMYVFSYFPSSKVTAWSTYVPSFESSLTTGKSFSGAGVITQTGLVIGQYYYFTQGNATSLTNGTQVLTADGFFTATATTATIVGPLSTLYSGSLVTQVPFVIQKMVVYNGIVYVRDNAGRIFQYGGSTGETFDHAVMSVQIPFLDAKKPATIKQGTNVDVSMTGKFIVEASMDYKTSPTPFRLISNNAAPTFDPQSFPFSSNGTHFTMKGRCADAIQAVLSALVFHYNDAGERR